MRYARQQARSRPKGAHVPVRAGPDSGRAAGLGRRPSTGRPTRWCRPVGGDGSGMGSRGIGSRTVRRETRRVRRPRPRWRSLTECLVTPGGTWGAGARLRGVGGGVSAHRMPLTQDRRRGDGPDRWHWRPRWPHARPAWWRPTPPTWLPHVGFVARGRSRGVGLVVRVAPKGGVVSGAGAVQPPSQRDPS